MNQPLPGLEPTRKEERLVSLDLLRGFAVLGILVMNIQSYGLIVAAYINPTAYGNFSGINRIVWLVSHILADQKFLSLFSILFGAGIILFCSRVEEKGFKPAALHYRRNFWLLIIGLIHGYLLWHGDILVIYSICAFIVFLFRKLKPKTLVVLGLISIIIPIILYLMFGLTMRHWHPEAIEGIRESWLPATEQIEGETAAYQGGFAGQMKHRVPAALFFQTAYMFMWTGWRAGGLMLIGMALFKWGVLQGKMSKAFYRKWLLWGLILGFLIILLGYVRNVIHSWSLEYSMFIGSLYNYVGSLFVAMAYIAGIVLLAQKPMSALKKRIAAVGRMAFSNYLGQTVVCVLIFYGFGLGLFGMLERWLLLMIVFAVWLLQLIVSPLWLKHFRFGPVEWAWRSLTYRKLQPMKNSRL